MKFDYILTSAPEGESCNSACSPLSFVLCSVKYRQLACYDCGSLDVGLDERSIGYEAFAFSELFDLVEHKWRVILARRVRSISLSKRFCDDKIHLFFWNGRFYRHRVGKEQARLDLERVLRVLKVLVR
jgi:hypothetical protein